MTYPVPLSEEAKKVWNILIDPVAIQQIVHKKRPLQRLCDLLLPKKWATASGQVAVPAGPAPKAQPDRVETIAPGAAYPIAPLAEVGSIIKQIDLIGMAAEITLAELQTNLFMSLDRAMDQVVTSIGTRRDLNTLATIMAVKGEFHQITGASWQNPANGDPIKHILQACNSIEQEDKGFVPDTLLVPDAQELNLATNEVILKILHHYKGDQGDASYDGTKLVLPRFVLNVASAPKGSGIKDPLVIASESLGGQAYAHPGNDATDEEHKMAEDGITVGAQWYGRTTVSPGGHTNVWHLAGDDARNPFVLEPKAAALIKSTA